MQHDRSAKLSGMSTVGLHLLQIAPGQLRLLHLHPVVSRPDWDAVCATMWPALEPAGLGVA